MSEPSSVAPRARTLPALLLFTTLGIVLLAGAFHGFELIGGKDWNYFLGQTEAEVSTVLRYGQFPLWNPWLKGGQVSFAQPESMFVSPVTLLAFAVGVLAAFKLVLLPLFVLGCLGHYRLARDLGLSGLAQLVPPLVFFGAGVFPLYLSGGLPNWLFGMSTLPWFVLFWRRALLDVRWVLPAALAYAFTLYVGSVHHFVYFAILLGTHAVCVALERRSVRPLLVLAAVQACGVAFSAFRLLPLIEVFGEFPREIDATSRYLSVGLLFKALLDHRLPDLWSAGGAIIRTKDTWIYWINCGSYIGPIAFLLALWGGLARARRTWTFTVPVLIFAWLALGSGVRPSLWDALHLLPVLGSMQAPERFMIFVVFGMSVLAGFGFQALLEWSAASGGLRPRFKRSFGPAVLALTMLPMLLVNAPISRTAFVVEPTPGLVRSEEFKQVRSREKHEQWGGELYESVRANHGNPIGSSDLPSRFAVRAEGDPGYRGEVYLLGERGAVSAHITPNEIRAHVSASGNDVLVVNQNYFPGWEATGDLQESPRPYEGLMSLPIAAGEHEIVLRYHPRSVPRGLGVTAAALLVTIGYAIVRRRGPAAGAGGPELIALALFLLLLAAVPVLAILDRSAVEHRADVGHASVLVVDARGGADAQYLDLQHAIDRAQPDDLILVRPGSYDGFRLEKGVAIIAQPTGQVTVRSRITIASLLRGQRARLVGLTCARSSPEAGLTVEACQGVVFLQSIVAEPNAPARPVLEVRQSERVHLIGCRLGSARGEGGDPVVALDHTKLVATRTLIEAPRARGAAAVEARDALVLLHETAVRGGDGGAQASNDADARGAGPALHLVKSRLASSSSAAVTLAGGRAPLPGPALVLEQGSRAVLSGTALAEPGSSADATSQVRAVDSPLPRMTMSGNQVLGSTLAIDVTGTPNARAFLLVGFSSMLVPVPGKNEWLQADITRPHAILPLRMNAAGKLRLRREIARDLLELGQGSFGQIAVERHPGRRDFELSLLEGSLFEIE